MVQDLQNAYRVYFQGREMIFDEMYDYLISAIRTGDTSDLPQVFYQVKNYQQLFKQHAFYDLYLTLLFKDL